ncbi:hypothetical protein ACRHK7_06630 [Weissella tructae]|uniref:hypothetical protein n=1 Tax=Weissella tructae TaxID=887702 RepID=UPI003D8A52AF
MRNWQDEKYELKMINEQLHSFRVWLFFISLIFILVTIWLFTGLHVYLAMLVTAFMSVTIINLLYIVILPQMKELKRRQQKLRKLLERTM